MRVIKNERHAQENVLVYWRCTAGHRHTVMATRFDAYIAEARFPKSLQIKIEEIDPIVKNERGLP